MSGGVLETWYSAYTGGSGETYGGGIVMADNGYYMVFEQSGVPLLHFNGTGSISLAASYVAPTISDIDRMLVEDLAYSGGILFIAGSTVSPSWITHGYILAVTGSGSPLWFLRYMGTNESTDMRLAPRPGGGVYACFLDASRNGSSYDIIVSGGTLYVVGEYYTATYDTYIVAAKIVNDTPRVGGALHARRRKHIRVPPGPRRRTDAGRPATHTSHAENETSSVFRPIQVTLDAATGDVVRGLVIDRANTTQRTFAAGITSDGNDTVIQVSPREPDDPAQHEGYAAAMKITSGYRNLSSPPMLIWEGNDTLDPVITRDMNVTRYNISITIENTTLNEAAEDHWAPYNGIERSTPAYGNNIARPTGVLANVPEPPLLLIATVIPLAATAALLLRRRQGRR